MVHGRGANAQIILSLSDALGLTDAAFLAPQAEGGVWYPQRFIEPIDHNQPWLSNALETVTRAIHDTGLPQERVALLGFSQGACLALETAYRVGGRFQAVIGFSGGLIGADEEIGATRGANLDGTPVLLGCSDVDFHIPLERVHRSAELLETAGAAVDTRIYPNFGHAINADEISAARALLAD
ncbi:MAG: phospholipase [Pleurocapsa sp. SU_196_0]|nr:phospholipase [Pleurocapsa sp. SU_196_0]